MNAIVRTFADLPLPVIGLLAIAHAQYDPEAEFRGWGGYGLLGSGVSTGTTLWTATLGEAHVDGAKIPCVRLTKRPDFHTGQPADSVDYLVPLASLRDLVGIEIDLVEAE